MTTPVEYGLMAFKALAGTLGESITYTPAGDSIPPFGGVAIFHDISLEKIIEHHIVSDTCECEVHHSILTVGGIFEPTKRRSQKPGDTITRMNLNGIAEVWEIIDSDWSPDGIWTLTLERNIKIHG
jgi:hypothetical protein